MKAIPLMVEKLLQRLMFLKMSVKGHKVIDMGFVWKGFIGWVYMPNI